jgi:hypothetical protein
MTVLHHKACMKTIIVRNTIGYFHLFFSCELMFWMNPFKWSMSDLIFYLLLNQIRKINFFLVLLKKGNTLLIY